MQLATINHLAVMDRCCKLHLDSDSHSMLAKGIAMLGSDSRVLIINSMGRSGTTLLQNMLSARYGLANLGEAIPYDETRPGKIRWLSETKGWVCKLFVELDTLRFDHDREIDDMNPDLIYNMYREDRLDQFLSHQISILSGHWNGDRRLEYPHVSIPDVGDRIRYFLDSLAHQRSLRESIGGRFEVIDLSYERLVSDLDEESDEWNRERNTTYGLSKQNTLKQKLDLVSNIDEVMAAWQELQG